ncbi:hypothetical protein [Polluticaenibacter yanchengensis]|uniref:J domain-containing protein n=1 Tax=Polluticaenibacter yanchengensis TaxID=3014562 RepID=A0ABT4UEF8_9BACT|nr:hypothetical protein [Chitinophagaceae bacterium LY-5]
MSHTNSLVIKAKDGGLLSKEQKMFNRLTLQIESLNRKIKENEILLEQQLKYYHENILPANLEIAGQKINIAILISDCAEKIKLSKTQSSDFAETILVLLTDAFQYVVPTAEQEAIYDKWSANTYQEAIDSRLYEEKQELIEVLEFFGIDMDKVDFNNPEDMAELQRKILEMQQTASENSGYSKNQKKSRTQLKKEAQQKETEAIQNKSIRDIYISLAKVLHPDSSDDSLDMTQKEELMKRLVNAYEKKDLPTLLALEIEWLNKQQNNIAEISEQKLNAYIRVLKDRVNNLNDEFFKLVNHPRYQDLGEEVLSSIKSGLQYQEKLNNRLKGTLKKYASDAAQLSNPEDMKAAFKKYVADFMNDVRYYQYRMARAGRNGW